MSDEIKVTQEEAIHWMESALRNWTRVARLSKDDVEDVRAELDRFRIASTRQLAADLAEAKEVLRMVLNSCLSGQKVPMGDGDTYTVSAPSHGALMRAQALIERLG